MEEKLDKTIRFILKRVYKLEPKLIYGYSVIEDIPYNQRRCMCIDQERMNQGMPILTQGMPILTDPKLNLYVLNFKDLIKDIVEAHESKNFEKRDFLLKTYKYTSTACPYFNNTFGILHDFEPLLNINEKTKLVNRCLPSTKKEYEQLEKENKDYFLSRKDLIINKDLDEQEALESKVWFLLSGRNKELHENIVKIIYNLNQKGSKLMGIYLPNDQKSPEIRAWCLTDFVGSFDAVVGDCLECDSRLLGEPQKR